MSAAGAPAPAPLPLPAPRPAHRLAWLPMALTRSRLALGPAIPALTLLRAASAWLAALLVAGLVSDILDGVIARRLRIVTPALRVADSRADGVYTFSLIASICIRDLPAVVAVWPALALLAGMEAASSVIDYRKYGRPSSHHAYSAKLWAASGFVAAYAVLVRGRAEPYLMASVALGWVNNLEGYVIRALLPRWAHDVSGIPAAARLRRAQLAAGNSERGAGDCE